MSKRLRNIQTTFFLYQMIILIGASSVFFFLIANGYVRNAKEEIKKDLDKASKITADYIKNSGDVPELIKESYISFVLHSGDGSYVIQRQDADESGGRFWESFRTKLTYQMQKQKNGQIIYPTKKPKEIFKNTKILQYTTLSGYEWIVITETLWPSEWMLLKNVINRNDLINFSIGICVGFFVLRVMTNVYFARLQDHISDSHEYNLGNFNQNIARSSLPEKNIPKSAIQIDKTVDTQSIEPKSKMMFSENALGVSKNVKPASSQKVTATPKIPPKIDKKETQQPVLKTPKEEENPKQDTPGEVHLSQKQPDENSTLNIEEIKSPVLKKLLEEMRNHKKNG